MESYYKFNRSKLAQSWRRAVTGNFALIGAASFMHPPEFFIELFLSFKLKIREFVTLEPEFPNLTVFARDEHKNFNFSALRGYHQEENQHPLMVSLSNHKQMISRNKMTERSKNLSFMELTIHTLKILFLAISAKSSNAMHQFGKLGDYDSLSPSTLRQAQGERRKTIS